MRDNANGQKKEHLQLFDKLITDSGLRLSSRRLFADGHYAIAVEQAFRYLDKTVRENQELPTSTVSALMQQAFSPNNPSLKFNALQTLSERDEQKGYMEMLAAAMTGIRNPRAHEPFLSDSPDVALELLVMANHFLRRVRTSTFNNQN